MKSYKVFVTIHRDLNTCSYSMPFRLFLDQSIVENKKWMNVKAFPYLARKFILANEKINYITHVNGCET